MTIPTTRPTTSPLVQRAPRSAADHSAPGGRDPEPRPAVGLAAVIEAGLRALDDLRAPCYEVTSGDLERALREAVRRHQQRTVPPADPDVGPAAGRDRLAGVAVAVSVACAHLSAWNLVEARLALRSAHDALPHRDRYGADATREAMDQARAVGGAVQRGLGDRAVLAQAVGVLMERTGIGAGPALAALHSYADRHRFVVSELAGDVVAERVAPDAVVARTVRRRGGRPRTEARQSPVP